MYIFFKFGLSIFKKSSRVKRSAEPDPDPERVEQEPYNEPEGDDEPEGDEEPEPDKKCVDKNKDGICDTNSGESL